MPHPGRTTEEEPSRRVVRQRIRNRIMEAASLLADGAGGAYLLGAGSTINWFFDWVPDDCTLEPDSALSAEEGEQLLRLCRTVNAAIEDTRGLRDDDFMRTPWPARMAAEAERLLAIAARRGRFDEAVEEAEPSLPGEWS